MDAILSSGRCVNVYARVHTTSTRQVLRPYAYYDSVINCGGKCFNKNGVLLSASTLPTTK